jgi:hypothetical protein|tara:strand:- start:83 stop:1468 length:1386 start_codon:yes stop_codon:yes gene_type:complete
MAKEIKNYLKSVKDITAPLNWKSSPDSPPTQLAYITQPEIDMLVKANIHGSMNGKPNKGPKGIISLDGGGVEYFKDDKPVSFGDQAGVTIDVSTQEGQDKRQEFRDKTGSNVVTDAEKKAREEQGRDPADTSAPPGGITTVSTKDDDEEEKQGAIEFFKTAFEKLKGKDLTKEISPQEMALYNALIGSDLGNRPDYSILEAFAKNLGAIGEQVNPLTRYLGLGGDGEELFRDDGEGLNIAKLRDLERELTGEEKSEFPFYGEIVDGGVSANLPGSLTLEGRNKYIDDMLGSEFQERLKRQNPEIYYPDNYMPATSGGLADLGGQAAINTTGMDRESDEYKQAVKYNNMIFSARSELDRMGKDMFGNKNMPTQTSGGGFVPPATTPDDPIIPQDPTLPPGVTPPATTPKFPGSVVTDYTQLGLPQIYGNPQMPNYATFNRAGSMPVGLQDYLDNLRKRFGIG